MIEYLQPIGLPVFRGQTVVPTSPPYLVFVDQVPDIFGSDDRVCYLEKRIRIEYYWVRKSIETEQAIEEHIGTDHYFTKSEDIFIPEENLWVTYYFI